MHHPMPCHGFKMDKPLRGPAFARYAPHALSRLKGRIGPVREICATFPFRFRRKSSTYHEKWIPFLPDKREPRHGIRYREKVKNSQPLREYDRNLT